MNFSVMRIRHGHQHLVKRVSKSDLVKCLESVNVAEANVQPLVDAIVLDRGRHCSNAVARNITHISRTC